MTHHGPKEGPPGDPIMTADAVINDQYVKVTIHGSSIYVGGHEQKFPTHAHALWHVMGLTPYKDYENGYRRCRVRPYGADVCVDFYQDDVYMGTEWCDRVSDAIAEVGRYVR